MYFLSDLTTKPFSTVSLNSVQIICLGVGRVRYWSSDLCSITISWFSKLWDSGTCSTNRDLGLGPLELSCRPRRQGLPAPPTLYAQDCSEACLPERSPSPSLMPQERPNSYLAKFAFLFSSCGKHRNHKKHRKPRSAIFLLFFLRCCAKWRKTVISIKFIEIFGFVVQHVVWGPHLVTFLT